MAVQCSNIPIPCCNIVDELVKLYLKVKILPACCCILGATAPGLKSLNRLNSNFNTGSLLVVI